MIYMHINDVESWDATILMLWTFAVHCDELGPQCINYDRFCIYRSHCWLGTRSPFWQIKGPFLSWNFTRYQFRADLVEHVYGCRGFRFTAFGDCYGECASATVWRRFEGLGPESSNYIIWVDARLQSWFCLQFFMQIKQLKHLNCKIRWYNFLHHKQQKPQQQ